MNNITISTEQLKTVFPFYIVLSNDFIILDTGVNLQKICPQLQIKKPVEDFFELTEPSFVTWNLNEIYQNLSIQYILKYKLEHQVSFIGRIIVQNDSMLYLCSLLMSDVSYWERFSPSLEETSPLYWIRDYVSAVVAHKNALANVEKLKKQLEKQNQILAEKEIALERANKERNIANEKQLKQEMEIGFEIQKALLLGKVPKNNNITIKVMNIPSQTVSGDFYDFFSHNTKCLDMVIGDVMGKGIAAALVAAALKSTLIRFASKGSFLSSYELLAPDKIVNLVHEEITPELIKLETFATLCYNRFDLFSQKLISVDCGHTNILHYHHLTGEVTKIKGDNIPVGVYADIIYTAHEEPFCENDIFLFYSDGVIDAKNQNSELLFGENNLIDLIKRYRLLSSDELLNDIKEELFLFSGEEYFKDDITCVMVKIEDIVSQTKMYNVLLIQSRLEEISRAREYVKKNAENLPFFKNDEQQLFNLLLATTETLSNIIKHGYKDDPNRMIRLEISIANTWIRICFIDKGIPFLFPQKDTVKDISSVAPDELEKMEGGFGLYLIHELVDKVTSQRDAKGNNYLCLIKNFINS